MNFDLELYTVSLFYIDIYSEQMDNEPSEIIPNSTLKDHGELIVQKDHIKSKNPRK